MDEKLHRDLQRELNDWFNHELDAIAKKYPHPKKPPKAAIQALQKELHRRSMDCAAEHIARCN